MQEFEDIHHTVRDLQRELKNLTRQAKTVENLFPKEQTTNTAYMAALQLEQDKKSELYALIETGTADTEAANQMLQSVLTAQAARRSVPKSTNFTNQCTELTNVLERIRKLAANLKTPECLQQAGAPDLSVTSLAQISIWALKKSLNIVCPHIGSGDWYYMKQLQQQGIDAAWLLEQARLLAPEERFEQLVEKLLSVCRNAENPGDRSLRLSVRAALRTLVRLELLDAKQHPTDDALEKISLHLREVHRRIMADGQRFEE